MKQGLRTVWGYLVMGAASVLALGVTLYAIRKARKGDITEGVKLLDDVVVCKLLPHRLLIRLRGAVGWQEGVQAYRRGLIEKV